jgi:hypothetical protein
MIFLVTGFFIVRAIDSIALFKVGMTNSMCTAKTGAAQMLVGSKHSYPQKLGILNVLSSIEPLEQELTEQDTFMEDVKSSINASLMEPIDTPVQLAISVVGLFKTVSELNAVKAAAIAKEAEEATTAPPAQPEGEECDEEECSGPVLKQSLDIFSIQLKELGVQLEGALKNNTIVGFSKGVPKMEDVSDEIPESMKTELHNVIIKGADGLVEAKDLLVNQSQAMIKDFSMIRDQINNTVYPTILIIFIVSLIPLCGLCCCSTRTMQKFCNTQELQAGIGTHNQASDETKKEYAAIPRYARCSWCTGFCWATFAFFTCAWMGACFIVVGSVCVKANDLNEDEIRDWLTISQFSTEADINFKAKFFGKCLHKEHAAASYLLDVLPGKNGYGTLAHGIHGGANNAVDALLGDVTIPLRNGGILPLYPEMPYETKQSYLLMTSNKAVTDLYSHIDSLNDQLGVNDTEPVMPGTYRCDVLDDTKEDKSCESCLLASNSIIPNIGNPSFNPGDWNPFSGSDESRRLESCLDYCASEITRQVDCDEEEYKTYLMNWKKRLGNVFNELDSAPIHDLSYDLRLALEDHIDNKVDVLANAVSCESLQVKYQEILDGACRQSILGGYMVARNYEYIGFCVLALVLFMYILWRRTNDNIKYIDKQAEQVIQEEDEHKVSDEDEDDQRFLLGGRGNQ